jgi:hypothetical protein
MGKDKTDKLVGGTKVKVPMVDWLVKVLAVDGTSEITFSGSAPDATGAALAAGEARLAYRDLVNAEQQFQAGDDVAGDPARTKTSPAR